MGTNHPVMVLPSPSTKKPAAKEHLMGQISTNLTVRHVQLIRILVKQPHVINPISNLDLQVVKCQKMKMSVKMAEFSKIRNLQIKEHPTKFQPAAELLLINLSHFYHQRQKLFQMDHLHIYSTSVTIQFYN